MLHLLGLSLCILLHKLGLLEELLECILQRQYLILIGLHVGNQVCGSIERLSLYGALFYLLQTLGDIRHDAFAF